MITMEIRFIKTDGDDSNGVYLKIYKQQQFKG